MIDPRRYRPMGAGWPTCPTSRGDLRHFGRDDTLLGQQLHDRRRARIVRTRTGRREIPDAAHRGFVGLGR